MKGTQGQYAEREDSILETDSEVDEFATGFTDPDVDEAEPEFSDEEEGEGVVQWAPDEWNGEGSESEEESEDGDDDELVDMRKLQNDLKSVPLATLMKAQRSLKQRAPSPSSSHSEASEAGPSITKEQRLSLAKAQLAKLQKRKGKASAVAVNDESADESLGAPRKEKRDKEREKERLKRENKHAPTAISSKKQVSRMRQVVDVDKKERRDPRFDSVSGGQVDPHLHAQSYTFLPQMLRDELAGLRTAVSMANKAERTCSWADKPARIAERERLELHLGKLRTKIERLERESKDRQVLAKAKKEERDKRSDGKGAWYMKKGEKKDLLLKSRFDDLEKEGGKTAVKKAIEKKRKKIAHKEKKSRPFAKGGEDSGKRRRVA